MNKQQMGEELNINNFILKYFITESEILCEGENHIVYGIEIEKRSLSQVEKSTVENITTDKTRVEEIIEVIKNNEVTPVHLYDVMENFL